MSFKCGEINAVNLTSSNHPTLKRLFVLKQIEFLNLALIHK
ncbi:hypothetical protein LINPERHAP2_LOCUS19008 [Linum perenne]